MSSDSDNELFVSDQALQDNEPALVADNESEIDDDDNMSVKQESDVHMEGDVMIKDEDVDFDLAYVAPKPTELDGDMVLYSSHGYDDFSWSKCKSTEGMTLAQQVQIMEKGVQQGLRYFDILKEVYESLLPQMPSLETQIVRLTQIRKNRKQCMVKVGFLGTTGTGKSSLIK